MAANPDTLPDANPRIREMFPGDIAAVAKIEQSAYPFPWTRGIFSDCLRAGYRCRVLAHGDTVSGYSVFSESVGEAHLLNLCIDPGRQGEGLGRCLLEAVMDEARLCNVYRMFLEVRPSNRSAIRLYRSGGFHVIGRRPGYYPAHQGREDAMVMVYHFD